jgi:hypothetical protein
MQILRPMPEQMIHQDNRHHGLCDWCGAYADTRIMPTFCNHFDNLALAIYAAPR